MGTQQPGAQQGQSAAQQGPKKPAPKRRPWGCIIWPLILVVATISLLGFGFLQPVQLAVVQEFVIGIPRGGIRETVQTTSVDSCIRVAGSNELQSITRTRRITTYNNGAVLELTFSDPPLPADCR